jgi:hypothetical protein
MCRLHAGSRLLRLKRLPDVFHTLSVDAQVRLAQPCRCAEVNNLLFRVEIKFDIIREAEHPRAKDHMQVILLAGNYCHSLHGAQNIQ